MNYLDLGYDSLFRRRSGMYRPSRLSPTMVRSMLPAGVLSAPYLGVSTTFTTDIVFSATDNDTASWTQGTINFPNGETSETIAAGNTGNISATTFIYYDKGTKATLQTTTTASSAVGSNKVLMCVVEKVDDATKLCKVTPVYSTSVVVSDISANQITAGTITSSEIATGTIVVGDIDSTVVDRLFDSSSSSDNIQGWVHASDVTKIDGGDIYTNTITATQIASNTITATEIAASTITATEMNVSSLSAIAADMGSITAGTITLDTSGYIRGGQTAYNTGTGFFLGYDTTTYKLSIGDASTNSLTWDGSTLSVRGVLDADDITAGTLSVDRISDTSLKNAKIDKPARAYKYIVASSGGDYTTIQGAIDAANADGGGRIFIKSGTYTQSSDITMYSNIELIGEDEDTTIIDMNNLDYCVKAIGTAAAHLRNIGISHLQFRNMDTVNIDNGVLYLVYVDDSVIERCYFKDNIYTVEEFGGDIDLSYCSRVVVRSNKHSGGVVGVKISQCTKIDVHSGYFDNYVSQYVSLSGSPNSSVVENYFKSGSVCAILVGTCDDVTIALNRSEGFSDCGVRIFNSKRSIVEGNRLIGTGTTDYGISIDQSTDSIATNNIIDGFDNQGIVVENNSDNNVLLGNRILNCGVGILISAGTEDKNIVASNQLLGNTTAFTDNGTGTMASANITV